MIAKKIAEYLLYLILSLILVGCSEDSGKDKTTNTTSSGSSGTSNGTTPLDTVSVAECAGTTKRQALRRLLTGNSSLSVKEVKLSEFRDVPNNPGFYSAGAAFTIPTDAISFQLIATEASASLTPTGLVFFYSVKTPDQLETISTYENAVFGTAWEPALPKTTLAKGDWSFIIINGRASGRAYLGIRSGTEVSRPILLLQPFLSSTFYSTTDLQAALTHMIDIYDNAGIQVQISETIVLPDKYAETDFEFTTKETASMVCQGDTEQINIFFIEDLIAADFGGGSVLGIAGGIPGPQGLQNRHNGVLIGLSAHDTGKDRPALANELLGETIAHETGHFLGLYHTTESTADEFDPLEDTPECRINNPTPERCLSKDGSNLMFWTAPNTSSIKQVTLTNDQQTVLKRAPIMR